jgi:hypothetical protein
VALSGMMGIYVGVYEFIPEFDEFCSRYFEILEFLLMKNGLSIRQDSLTRKNKGPRIFYEATVDAPCDPFKTRSKDPSTLFWNESKLLGS